MNREEKAVVYIPSRTTRWVAFAICSIFILYAAIRAWTVAITHDEAYTYEHFVNDSVAHILSITHTNANNHLLNSLFCKWIDALFGNHLFVMRMYVIAFLGIYLWYAYRLLRYTQNDVIILCGLVFAGANPFLLDFFSLLRGYGGGMACFMAGLFYAARFIASGSSDRRSLWKCLVTMGLSVFFHLSFYNIFLPFCGAIWLYAVIINWKKQNRISWREILRYSLPVVLIVLLVSGYAMPRAFFLKKTGDLDFGGTAGLWNDVGYTLFYFSTMGKQYGLGEWWNWPLFEYVITGLFFLAGIVFFIQLVQANPQDNKDNIYARKFPFFVWLITALLILSIQLQHYVLGNTYPNGRLVIFLIPLYGLVLLYLLWFAVKYRSAFSIFPAMLGVIFIVHLACAGNFTHSFYWSFDADTDTMLADLKQITASDPKPVKLGADWFIEPGGNYYRIRYGYESWLPEFTRDGLKANQAYFYCHKDAELPVKRYEVLKYYPVSGYRLLRNLEYKP